MKNKLLLILLAALFPFCLNAEPMGYFRISVAESFLGVDMKDGDAMDLDATNSLWVNAGYRLPLSENKSLTFFYEAAYDGPGAKSNSKEGFQARSMDQFFMARMDFLHSESLKTFLRADFFYEFYRLGKTEPWAEGLYNFGKVGLSYGADWLFSKNQLFSAGLEGHFFWFPNYTDLSREAIYLLSGSGGLSSDSVNQNFWQGSFFLTHRAALTSYFDLKSQYRFAFRSYPSLKTDDDNLNPSDNESQQDMTHSFKVEPVLIFSKVFSLASSYRFTYFKSNYNYLFVKSFSPVDYEYFKDFSSFYSHEGGLAFSAQINPAHALILEGGLEYKKYLTRPAKKASGNYDLSQKQYLQSLWAGLTYEVRLYDDFKVALGFLYKKVSSNNTDLSAGYNFSVYGLTVQLTMEY